MISNSDPSSQTNENLSTQTPLKIPRLTSLLHRLRHAEKTPNGEPIPLLDELFFFLDDPPPGTTDRWQKGAEFCLSHGIRTTRMSLWRLYRTHILQWRREQNPAPPAPPPSPEETTRLHDRSPPRLPPSAPSRPSTTPASPPATSSASSRTTTTVSKSSFARDRFDDRRAIRRRREQKEHFRRLDHQIRDEHLLPAQMKSIRQFISILLAISPRNTP